MMSSQHWLFVCNCAHAAHDVLTVQSAVSSSGYKRELLCDRPVNE